MVEMCKAQMNVKLVNSVWCSLWGERNPSNQKPTTKNAEKNKQKQILQHRNSTNYPKKLQTFLTEISLPPFRPHPKKNELCYVPKELVINSLKLAS